MLKTVFISSTFADMHRERDIIQSQVIPSINRRALKFGDSVSSSDLRWGIDTSIMEESEGNKKILNVCLKEIDRCSPYMIVMLGDRYGWIPGPELLEKTLESLNDFNLNDLNISVTELEIEYGALYHLRNINHTLFYFREETPSSEKIYDSVSAKKLKKLKEKIQSVPGVHIKTYTLREGEESIQDMSRFSEMVQADLLELMEKEWKEKLLLSKYELDQIKHRNMMESKGNLFSTRQNLKARIIKELENGEDVFVTGESGSGKSTLVSSIIQSINGFDLVPIYVGNSEMSNSPLDLVREYVWFLEQKLQLNHLEDQEENLEPEEWIRYYNRLVQLYDQSQESNLLFVAEGLDHLKGRSSVFPFIPSIKSHKVRFLVSSRWSEQKPVGFHTIHLGWLSPDESKEVIDGLLKEKHRELNSKVIESLINRQFIQNPLYLSMIIERLMMMNEQDFRQIAKAGGNAQAIADYQIHLIQKLASRPEELAVQLFSHGADFFGLENGEEIGLWIASGRRGFRIEDLKELSQRSGFSWNYLGFIGLLQYLNEFFIYRDDGRIEFSHQILQNGFLELEDDEEDTHRKISAYLMSLEETDEIRNQELVWHILHTEQKEDLSKALLSMFSAPEYYLEGVGHDIAQKILEDQGRWIFEAIDANKLSEGFSNIVSLLVGSVLKELEQLPDTWEIRNNLLFHLFEVQKERTKKNPSFGNIWDYNVISEGLAVLQKSSHGDLKAALENTLIILNNRKSLINYLQSIPEDKELEFFKDALWRNNLWVNDILEPKQAQNYIQSMVSMVIRGVAVAHENAGVFLFQMNQEKEALDHFFEALRIRKNLMERSDGSIIKEDETVELANLLNRLGVLLSYRDFMTGLEFINEGIAVIERPSNINNQAERQVELAGLFRSKGLIWILHNREKALANFEKAKTILEDLSLESPNINLQVQLAEVYCDLAHIESLLGNYKHFHKYDYQAEQIISHLAKVSDSLKIRELQENFKMDSIKNRLQFIHKKENLTLKTVTEPLIAAWNETRYYLMETGSQEAFDTLQKLGDLMDDVAIASTDKKAVQRVRAEIKAFVGNHAILLKFLSIPVARKMVINLAQVQEEVEESECFEDLQDPELRDFLEAIGLPIENVLMSKTERAYDLGDQTISVSKSLFEKTQSITDLDFYVVSLTRHMGSLILVHPEEAQEAHQSLKQMAYYLYTQTQDPKYLKILAAVELYNKFLSDE